MKRLDLKRGFTVVQLVVVIVLFIVLLAFLMPTRRHTHRNHNRIHCQSNLSQIGKGLMLYSNENKGSFPRGHYVNGAPVQITNDGFDDANPFAIAPEGRKINNIPQAMFLLVRTQDLTTEVFICPSGTAEKDLMANLPATQRGNFTGTGQPGGEVIGNLSYSFVNVYPTSTAIATGYKTFITGFSSDFAVAADLAPAATDSAVLTACRTNSPRAVIVKGNSKTHDGDGQNVVYADGHAEFQQTPLCGPQNDNIFTAQDPSAEGLKTAASRTGVDPQSATDSVLLIHSK